jgi:hypothetical protein
LPDTRTFQASTGGNKVHLPQTDTSVVHVPDARRVQVAAHENVTKTN